MGVKCLILFRKTKDGVFRAGQSVTGTLKYLIDKPTKFQSIDIFLLGKGKCQWSDSHTDDSTTYYHNKEEYVNISKNLLKARDNQNILSGTYERSFEFFLPDNIPTSFKNKFCKIEYKVFVTFVKDNFFGTKYKFDAEVPVYGFVSPCSPEPLIFGLSKNLFSLTANNNVDVKAEIERTFLTPGENIKLRLTVNNNTDDPITIKTELIKYFTYVSDNKRQHIDKESMEPTTGYSPTMKEKTVSGMTCIIPTLPNLYSIQHTKIMIGEYKVRVTAKLPFPHRNAVVEVPVVIGERRDHLGAGVIDYESPSSSKTPEKEVTDEETVEDYFAKYDKNLKHF